jgi:predicted MFS family arabinose efflux permease
MITEWLLRKTNGKATLHVAAVLALALGLDSADMAAVGAMASYIEKGFNIDKTHLGLLITLSSSAAAVSTIVFGWLTDRYKRIPILSVAVLCWGVLMAISTAASSYTFLLLTRILMGASFGANIPVIASLVGDYFSPGRRGEVYSYILAGELLGTAFGFIAAGELALISWRLGFVSVAVVALLTAWLVYRLPEPARDGSSRIPAGAEKPGDAGKRKKKDKTGDEDKKTRLLTKEIRENRIEPRKNLIYDEDPQKKSLWWAIMYVFRIPTNIILITSSTLGYLFFAVIRTFGVEYVQGRYNFSHSVTLWIMITVGIGALVGVLAGGHLGDRLLEKGHINGRIFTASWAYLLAAILFLPGLLLQSAWLSLPLFWLAGSSLLAVNPPLDAARLDIMHGHLWGRAESIRSIFRKAGEAAGPFVFGFFADQFGGKTAGLRDSFLIMLIPLAASGLICFAALATYSRDVATADAFMRHTADKTRR